MLEKTSNKKCCKDFSVCYNPDFIALGNIVQNFLNPDMILIGESDEGGGSILENIHRKLVENRPNIHRMNFYNAELTKIALNSYCTLKITFANELAKICESVPGGDVDVVLSALGDDERIGHKYLKGGLSYGGPCFPRDNRAIAYTVAKFGGELELAKLTDALNDYHKNERIPNLILNILEEKKTNRISVLGLTYKPDTTLVEEAAAISIINALSTKGIHLTIFDPAGMDNAKIEIKATHKVEYAASAKDCIQGHIVCLIATPWKEFSKLTKEDFVNCMKDPVVIDGWNLYSFTKTDGIDYRAIGRSKL